jgi:hypothetical protein
MSQELPDLDGIIPEPIAPSNDKLANSELANLYNDARRKDGFKGHMHNIIIIAMYVAAFFVLCLFIIRFWHFAAPSVCCWLDKDRLHDIERVIFSSAFITALSFYFKNVFKLKD